VSGGQAATSRVRRHSATGSYEGKISKWSIPDDVLIVSELPHTATGKLSKKAIRQIILENIGRLSPDLGS